MITSILVLVGFLFLLLAGWGFLSGFANGMSDVPSANADTQPLYTFIAGVAGFLIVVVIGVWRAFA